MDPSSDDDGKVESRRQERRLMRLIAASGLVLVVVAIAIYLLLGLFTRPGYYGSYSWLDPYVTSWRASTHAEVPCASCHFPSEPASLRAELVGLSLLVQSATGTGSPDAFALAPEEACAREGCHADILDEGDVLWKSIHFSHADHLGQIKRGLRPSCTTCHQSLVHGTGRPVQTEACTLCHFKEIGWEEDITRCEMCHRPEALAEGRYKHESVLERGMPCMGCHADVAHGEGNVDRDRCIACHTLGERAETYANLEQVHAIHVTGRGFPCTFCHDAIEHEVHPLVLGDTEDCDTCHRAAHAATRELYVGLQADDPAAARRPDAMAAVHVHCLGCHVDWEDKLGGDATLTADAEACNACHEPGYGELLGQWRQLLERSIGAARPAVRAAQQSARQGEAEQMAERARVKLEQVMAGHGVHNITFAVEQLDGAIALANEALQAAGSGQRFARLPEARRLGSDECARCHVQVPETVAYKGMRFPHRQHTVAVEGCTACHTPFSDHGKLAWGREACGRCHGGVPLPHGAGFQRRMGEVVARTGFGACLQCHDGEAERTTCRPCHEPPPGDVAWGPVTVPHGIHISSGIDCATCHAPLARHGQTIGVDGCAECHGGSGGEVCATCHGGGPAAVAWEGMDVPHEMHVEMTGDCTACHPGMDAHGGPIAPSSCADCHGVPLPHPDDFAETHGAIVADQGEDACATCHTGGMAGEFCAQCHG